MHFPILLNEANYLFLWEKEKKENVNCMKLLGTIVDARYT